MILITPAQCRAARALLNWSQPDLAERCGVHVQTIGSFENEVGSPTKKTLQKILTTLEHAGIDFLPGNAVGLSENKFYPSNSYIDILDDCLHSFPIAQEILFHCADDTLSSEKVIKKLEELANTGIKMRATTFTGNNLLRPFRDYRLIPSDYFNASRLTVIYGDKFCLHTDNINKEDRFITIKNKTLANAMRRQFEYWWKNGKPVPTA